MENNRLTQLSYLIFSVWLCWLMSLPAHAATEAGRILFARGTISIVGDGEAARGGSTGSVFYEGDRVVTGNNSIVQLRLSDGALTALRSNSDYQVERQRFDEQEGIYEQAGKLLSGWMRSVTGTIGTRYPDKVSLGTSVATIGIRGTTYQIIHVPEQGLAEFPNLQPGSYVYLEEGQVEVSNEAGSRVVSPGQVVRIAAANVAPELTPALLSLFQSPLLISTATGSDSFQVRNLLEGEESQIVDEAADDPRSGGDDDNPPGAETGLPAFVTTPSALIGGCSECTGFSLADTTAYAGSGDTKYLTEISDGAERYILTNASLLPISTGSLALYNGAALATQVHWGRWQEGDFTPSENGQGDLHYIMADNVVSSANGVGALPLAGRYRYNFVGGSAFTEINNSGAGDTSLTMEESSRLIVDFFNMEIDAELVFAELGTLSCAEDCTIASFYSGNFYLNNYAQQQGNNASGYMQGAFLGAEGEGVMSLISIFDETTYIEYMGMSVFEREQQSLPDDPLPQQGLGLVGGCTACGGFILSDYVSYKTDGNEKYLTEMSRGGDTQILAGSEANHPSIPPETLPLGGDSLVLYSGSNEVARAHWGYWQEGDYTIDGLLSEDGYGNLHYIIADNVILDPVDVGLTGKYRYNFAGGAEFAKGDGAGVAPASLTMDGSSQLIVDFSTMSIAAELTFTDIGTLVCVEDCSLANFYSGNYYLIDYEQPLPGSLYGSMQGAFLGAAGEGIMSVLTVDYNVDAQNYGQYVGTPVFERESQALPEAVDFTGVSAFSTSIDGPVIGPMIFQNLLELETTGSNWYPARAESYHVTSYDGLGTYSGNQYMLIASDVDQPVTQESHTLATGNIVYWGIWAQDTGGYTAERNGMAETTSSDWHYMIAQGPIAEGAVASLAGDLGLVGTYRYNYVNGTSLQEINQGNTSLSMGVNSYVDINFADLAGSGVSASLEINTNTMTGSGSISDLYGVGIGLLDSLDVLAEGSIMGTLAGQQAEALLGAVTYDYNNTESYLGTALFERTTGVGQ